MRALGYYKAHELADFAITEMDVPEPVLGEYDLLVDIRAIATNPIDTKQRRLRSATGDHPVILGWDASGVVLARGSNAHGFKPGDEVYYAGDITRDGAYAERQIIDSRLVAHKPKSLTFAEAAALPLTAITAYEMLFDQFQIPENKPCNILIIGGAGGVGSIAIQLLQSLTHANIYATSGRPESREWLESQRIAGIFDRTKPLHQEMLAHGVTGFHYVFCTTHTTQYLPEFLDILHPFGRLGVIDGPEQLDILPFKAKAIGVFWEFMFARPKYGFFPEKHGKILTHIAQMADAGNIESTARVILPGITPANIRAAHGMLEDHTALGKIVLTA